MISKIHMFIKKLMIMNLAFLFCISRLSCDIYLMDSIPSLESIIGSGIQGLDSEDWSPVSASLPDELRLPKKRRYLGEDMSSHSWDTRGTLSTDPPTPFIMEQQELADENAQHNDMVPFYATLSQRTVYTHAPAARVSGKSLPTPKNQSVSDGSPTSGATRVRWTEEDDKILINLVSELGHNWPLIASRMDGRTSKQVKERWTNQLDPTISTEPWTAEDDHQLVILIRELGHSWCEIARRMKGRTESMVKNRFHANLRKRFGNHIFDPSVPLPPLSFKPKSVKTKSMFLISFSNDFFRNGY